MLKVYSAVRLFFFAVAATAIGSVISNIDALEMLGGFASLLGGILSIFAIYQLRSESRRFATAFRLIITYICIAAAMIILLAMSLVSIATSDISLPPSLILALIAAFVVLILSLVTQYQTFKGFDEMRALRHINYPPRRILWCFYLAVFSMLLSLVAIVGAVLLLLGSMNGGDAVLQSAMNVLDTISNILLVSGVVLEAIELWLLFTYMQATQEALENESRGGGIDYRF